MIRKAMGLNVFSLSGKLALVTGGGTGIGFGVSKAMIVAGAKVVITGRREAALKEAVASLGKNAWYFKHDIRDKARIPALVEQVESEIVPIDILVNNAGIHLKKKRRRLLTKNLKQCRKPTW